MMIMYSPKVARFVALPLALIASAVVAGAQIYPYAGTGVSGSTGIGGDSRQLQLNRPYGIAVDGAGNGYIADMWNQRVVRVDANTHIATVFAGNGQVGSSGDGGPASQASLNYPVGLAFDSSSNLYISEINGNRIRKVDSTGIITTIAGTGTGAHSGDGGPASAAGVQNPCGLAYDPSGILYVVESALSLRAINLNTGIITTFNSIYNSINGITISSPQFITVEDAINGVRHVLVSDQMNHTIWRVDPNTGVPVPFAGNGAPAFTGDGVAATNSGLGSGMPVPFNDQVGGIYIADPGSNRIRRVDRDTGIIETVAGNGFNSPPTTAGPAGSTALQGPEYVMASSNGFTLFADNNNRVWQLVLPPAGSHPYTSTVTPTSNPTSPGTGQSVTLTTIVSPINSNTLPTGNVTFEDMFGNVIGTAPLSASVASLTTTAPSSTGTYTIYASYSGDPNYYGSTSPAGSVVVQAASKVATTTSIYSGPNPSAVNTSVGVNITVTPQGSSSFAPTGAAQLLDGGTVVATTSVQNGLGYASVYLSSLGTHSLTAVYSGDTNFSGSTSAPFNQVVKNLATGTISTSLNPSNAGAAVTFTAVVYQSGATGTITFNDAPNPSANSVPIGTVALNNGQASFTTSTLSVGTHLITAAYSGDANYTPFGTSYIPQVVNGVPTATTMFSGQNPNAVNTTVGMFITVTPQGSSSATMTGSVQVMEGATVLGTASVQNGSAYVPVSFSTTGTHTLTAVYSGDAVFSGSTSAALNQVVKNMATGYITTSLNPATAGAPISFNAVVYQSGPTGSITFNDRASPSGNPVAIGTVPLTNNQASFTISTLSVGTHLITAAYSGDANYVGFETSYISEVVNQAATTTTLNSSQNPAPPGVQLTFQTTVTPPSGSTVQPSGTVQLLDGSTVLTSANVTNGSAQLTYSFGTTGTHTLTAVYSGDVNCQGSTSAVLTQSVKSPSSMTLSSTPNPSTDGAAAAFTAIVQQSGASGTVDLLDGGTTLGSATLTNGSATFSFALSAGSHTITANYRGDTNFQPSSATLTQVVKANTTTTITANPASATVGQAVQFSATVAPAAATGTVQFFEGGTSLGTAAVSNGVAVLSISTFAAGTHNVNSLYSGDAAYASSSSSYAGVVISKVAATLALASSSNPSVAGQSVTFTAAIAPAAATGTVQFLDGATVLGTATLSGGSAAFTTASLAAGSHAVTANYSGDSTYNTASATVTQVVKSTTATAVSASPASATFGQAVQLTASVTPAAATGSVQFLDGATPLGTVPLSSGAALLNVSTLSVGAHSISAVYSGDGGDASSTSAVFALTVSKASTSVALGASPNPSTFGSSVTMMATVSPASATGSVQFLDGSTLLGTAAVAGGTASIGVAALSAGTHSLSAQYSGDGNYVGAGSAAWTQTVNKAASAASVRASANPGTYGQPVTFTALVSPGSVSGSVQFMDGATVLGTAALSAGSASFTTSSLTAGTHSISVQYGGDANYLGSSSPALSEVVKIGTATSLSSNGTPSTYGHSVQFNATVSPAAATGTVQFLDGTTVLGTSALNNGKASFSTSSLSGGSHAITAIYSGGSTYLPSTSAVWTETVNTANASASLNSSLDPSTFGQSVTLTATVSPTTATGSVQFLDGSAVLDTVVLSSGRAALTLSTLAVGAHKITAAYSGDTNYNSAVSGPMTQNVNQVKTSTALVSSLNPSPSGQSVSFTASVSPAGGTGTVQFLDNNQSLGTTALSGSTAVLTIGTLAAGSHNIKAVYSGDASYSGSTSGQLKQVVN
jgi:large repetitive protein